MDKVRVIVRDRATAQCVESVEFPSADLFNAEVAQAIAALIISHTDENRIVSFSKVQA